jgi:hypothetical protein
MISDEILGGATKSTCFNIHVLDHVEVNFMVSVKHKFGLSGVPHCRREVPKSRVDRVSKYFEGGWLAIVSRTTHPNVISCVMIYAP